MSDPRRTGNGEIDQTVAATTRELRERANLSLSQLAQRAGVSKATLSQLEAAKANPSIDTVNALARALGVPIAELLSPRRAHARVVRSGDGVPLAAGDSSYRSALLDSTGRRGSGELYVLEQDPGSIHHGDVHPAGVVEFVYVVSGRMRVGPDGATVDLDGGDFASFEADRPHSYEALMPGTRALLLMSWP